MEKKEKEPIHLWRTKIVTLKLRINNVHMSNLIRLKEKKGVTPSCFSAALDVIDEKFNDVMKELSSIEDTPTSGNLEQLKQEYKTLLIKEKEIKALWKQLQQSMNI